MNTSHVRLFNQKLGSDCGNRFFGGKDGAIASHVVSPLTIIHLETNRLTFGERE